MKLLTTYITIIYFGICSFGQDETGQLKPMTEVDSERDGCNVKIFLEHYSPYCGGAYPDESDLNHIYPIQNATYHLVDLSSGTKSTVKTDETGNLYLKLKPGKYGLKEIYKDCSLDDFLAKYFVASGGDMQSLDMSCYENWWKSCFIEFDVTSVVGRIELRYTFVDACFTGMNPCISYFGPYPP